MFARRGAEGVDEPRDLQRQESDHRSVLSCSLACSATGGPGAMAKRGRAQRDAILSTRRDTCVESPEFLLTARAALSFDTVRRQWTPSDRQLGNSNAGCSMADLAMDATPRPASCLSVTTSNVPQLGKSGVVLADRAAFALAPPRAADHAAPRAPPPFPSTLSCPRTPRILPRPPHPRPDRRDPTVPRPALSLSVDPVLPPNSNTSDLTLPRLPHPRPGRRGLPAPWPHPLSFPATISVPRTPRTLPSPAGRRPSRSQDHRAPPPTDVVDERRRPGAARIC